LGQYYLTDPTPIFKIDGDVYTPTGCGQLMNETECTTETDFRWQSCSALVAAVAKVSHLRFRDARVLFDPIIREAALIRMQEMDMDQIPSFDRMEDAISYFSRLSPDSHDLAITTAPGGAVKLNVNGTCPFRHACQIMNEETGSIEGCAEAITLLQVIERTCQQTKPLTYDFQPARNPDQGCTIYIGTVEQIVLNQGTQNLYDD